MSTDTTPTPLKIMPNDTGHETMQNCVESLWIADADGKCFVRITDVSHASATKQDRERARLIVQAVNERAALLAERDALKAALRGLMDCAGSEISSSTDAELRDAAENGSAPEIRQQATAWIAARAALAQGRHSDR